jgi:hypothetical protein
MDYSQLTLLDDDYLLIGISSFIGVTLYKFDEEGIKFYIDSFGISFTAIQSIKSGKNTYTTSSLSS